MDPFSAGRPNKPKSMKLGGARPRPPAGGMRGKNNAVLGASAKPRPPGGASSNHNNNAPSPWFSSEASSSANVFGAPAPGSAAPSSAASATSSSAGPTSTGSYRSTIGQPGGGGGGTGYGSTIGQVGGYGGGVNGPGSSRYQRPPTAAAPKHQQRPQPPKQKRGGGMAGPGMFNPSSQPSVRGGTSGGSVGGVMMSGKMGDRTGARTNRAGSGGNTSSSFIAPGDFSAPPPPAVGGGSGAPGMMTGKMGQPTGSGGAAPSSSTRPMSASSFDGTYDFSGEPPLLEELGVDMRRIWYKTLAVVNPLKRIDVSIMKAQDSDLAGPLIFACTLGALLMFQGKLQFGYVFGLMVFGSLALSMLFNLMAQESQVTFFRTVSILGYCMLPTLGLAAISIVVRLNGWMGLSLGVLAVVWCVYVSTTFFEHALNMPQHRWLIAYPVFIFYSCFVMLAVF